MECRPPSWHNLRIQTLVQARESNISASDTPVPHVPYVVACTFVMPVEIPKVIFMCAQVYPVVVDESRNILDRKV